MKAFAVQSDSKLVITTSKQVMAVTKEFMLLKEKEITVQESNVVSDFEILSCALLNPTGVLMVAQASVYIGRNMTIDCEAFIQYRNESVCIDKMWYSFAGEKVHGNDIVDPILIPLIRDHVEEKFKPQIHQFYNEH